MANKGGAQWQDRLNALGTALSGYGSALSGNPMHLQNSLMMQQVQQQRRQQEQQERQDQVANIATRSLMRGGSQMNDANKMGMLRLMAPGAMQSALAQQAISQLFPQGFSGTVGKNEKAFVNGKVVAEGPVDAPEPVRGVTMGNRIVNPITGETIREFPAEQKDGESWAPVTKELAASLGLNPTGSYQRNSKGQIQVITQPKQDAPTETQARYGYNAKRVAGSLAKVNEVLAKDPGAASSWALETFAEGPIASRTGVDVAARKFVNPNAQVVRNNMVDAIDAVITLGTGAAYTKEQLEAARASYMPRPGEPANVKQDKFRKLLEVYEQARVNARTAGEDLPDPSAFAGLFGMEQEGFTPAIMQGQDNDPLGIRGR